MTSQLTTVPNLIMSKETDIEKVVENLVDLRQKVKDKNRLVMSGLSDKHRISQLVEKIRNELKRKGIKLHSLSTFETALHQYYFEVEG